MSFTVDTGGIERAKQRTRARMGLAARAVFRDWDARIGVLVTEGMVAGAGRGKNNTPYLRRQTNRLYESYRQRTDAEHVYEVKNDGKRVTLRSGTKRRSPSGFPYPVAHEEGGKLYIARPHMARAIARLRASKDSLGRDLKAAFAKATLNG